jgi:glycine/D-amino acid oxidase-like deaminating enzyme
MKLLSSRPLWPIEDGLPDSYAPLDRDARCDVAVIGGGVTGALVAWQLTRAGVSCVVLDRREAAHGSTAGSTSLLQYEIDEPLHRMIRTLGRNRAERSYRRCRAALDAIALLVRRLRLDCGFERKASLYLASDRSQVPGLRDEFAARRAAGFAVEWWDRSRLKRESTLPQPAGILSRDAAQIDAYRFTYGLLTASRAAGAAVHDRSPVLRTRFHPRGVELFLRHGRRVRARCLVVAAGYEADQFLPRPVTVLRSTYALASEPVREFPGWPADRCLIWETRRPYVYLRTTARGRIIIGGYDEPFRDPAARDRLLGRKRALLERRFRQLFPRIPLETAEAWAGTFADTAHGLPCIGRHPTVPHTWFALGYGGNGITFSLIASELIRDGILGRRDPDAELFGFGRSEER